MFIKGQSVKFKRSNGVWCNGLVKETKGENVTIQWIGANSCRMGTKKLHELFVKKNISLLTKRNILFVSLILGGLLLADSFFYLKKVNF